ncbi:MAG: AAA family ATPase [Myxococcales bacterium]|nr:AAA family ATPase [Myxococcales bacterium]MCB9598491.1 AAA family ATPase [Sandaracinaceae bacterium]MCB9733299.1 AAA family ATPase [Deltaproteobacteria bacterium]
MIIGLTGKFAAGKGTVAEVLTARGFRYHSLSDVLREELAARGIAESREALTAVGNELRRDGGPDVLARRIQARLQDGGDHIVDSIRNPAEVAALREVPGFFLLGVDADRAVRFERLRARARQGDPTTFEQFAALEDKETHSVDPTTQRLAATFDLADEVVRNDGPIDALHAAVLEVVARRR